MPNNFCGCGRCTVDTITGPVLLIALGVLFALGQAGYPPFRRTWPVLLIVYGVARAIAAVAPTHDRRTQ